MGPAQPPGPAPFTVGLRTLGEVFLALIWVPILSMQLRTLGEVFGAFFDGARGKKADTRDRSTAEKKSGAPKKKSACVSKFFFD